MGFFAGEEKVLAFADDNCHVVSGGADRLFKRFGRSAVYLHTVLGEGYGRRCWG